MSKKKDAVNIGGTASDIGLIPIQITLKDDEFDQFIRNSLSILDKPPTRYKLDTDGVFKEDQEQIKTWEEFFKLYGNSKDLEDFLEDREQDTPKDIDL